MTKEIEDNITEAMESIEHFDIAYNNGRTSSPKEYEDDCFLHILRGKYGFVFYNGEDKGRLKESDIPHYAKMVDKIWKKIKVKVCLIKRSLNIRR